MALKALQPLALIRPYNAADPSGNLSHSIMFCAQTKAFIGRLNIFAIILYAGGW